MKYKTHTETEYVPSWGCLVARLIVDPSRGAMEAQWIRPHRFGAKLVFMSNQDARSILTLEWNIIIVQVGWLRLLGLRAAI